MSKKNRSKFRSFAIFIILSALAVGVMGYSAFYGNALKEKTSIYISSATTYEELHSEITQNLKSALHRFAFDFYASRLNLKGRINAGYSANIQIRQAFQDTVRHISATEVQETGSTSLRQSESST